MNLLGFLADENLGTETFEPRRIRAFAELLSPARFVSD